MLATVIGYVLLNITLHTNRYWQWQNFEECQKLYSKDPLNIADECKGIVNIADGASNIFYLYLGWIPAAGYAGFFELLWRIKYRKIIKKMGKQFKGKLFSNFVIITAIPVWIVMFFILLLAIFMNIYCFIDFSNDKC